MNAEFKKNQRLDVGTEVGAEIRRSETGKWRQSGIEAETATGGPSGRQFDEKKCLVLSLFTSCTVRGSLLEPIEVADKAAVPGDVILRSPTRSNLNWSRIYQESEIFLRGGVSGLGTATGSRVAEDDPNRQEAETD